MIGKENIGYWHIMDQIIVNEKYVIHKQQPFRKTNPIFKSW